MADTAAIAAQDMRKLAQTSNPLEVVQNPIVVSVSLGVLGAYMARKSLYTSRRDLFGWAAKGPDGRVRYYKVGPDGKPGIPVTDPKTGEVKRDPKTGQEQRVFEEHPDAYTNRILLNLGGVILGSLLINNKLTEDPMVDYIGLGVAAGSFANLVMTILNID